MNIGEEFLRTYKFYDTKHRRLAIFAKYHTNTGKLKIYVVTTSKKDKFDKDLVRTMFNNYIKGNKFTIVEDIHPQIFIIPSTEENFKKDFISFCRQAYWYKSQMLIGMPDVNKVMLCDCYYNFASSTYKVDDRSARIQTMPKSVLESYNKQREAQSEASEEFEKRYKSIFGVEDPNINPEEN